jgi:general secretion pathway protein G
MDTQKKDKGFTLVELLIVIVILGILATVTVFAVRGITDQGQESACKATAKTYEVAIEAFYAKNGNAVDPSGADLVADELIRSYDATDVAIDNSVSPSAVVSGSSGVCDAVL